MKVVFLRSCIFLLFALSCFGRQALGANEIVNEKRVDKTEVEYYDLMITVDPRVEFMDILNMISKVSTSLPALQEDYKLRILDWFDQEGLDELMQEYANMHKRIFKGDVAMPVQFVLSLDDNMQWNDNLFSDELGEIPKKDLNELSDLLRQIQKQSNFNSFYHSNQKYYQKSISRLVDVFEKSDERQSLIDYFRVNDLEMQMKLMLSINGAGNFGVRLSDTHGKTQEYVALINPNTLMECNSQWPQFDKFTTHNLFWHEFSHTLGNTYIYKHGDLFVKSESLFKPIEMPMNVQAYPDWITCMTEHLVRAVTVRMAERKYGKEISRLYFYDLEKASAFIYIDVFLEELEKYEQDPEMSFEEVVIAIGQRLASLPKGYGQKLFSQLEEKMLETPTYIDANKNMYADLIIVVPESVDQVDISNKVEWPGNQMHEAVNGWYYMHIDGESKVNMIFNNGKGFQTDDLLGISSASWYDGDENKWTEPKAIHKFEKFIDEDGLTVFFRSKNAFKGVPNLYYWKELVSFEEYIVDLRNKFFSDTEIVSGEEALEKDLSDYNILTYGNAKNNAYISSIAEKLPFKMLANGGFVADRVYDDDDIVLTSSWVNPDNKSKSLKIVYSANKENFIESETVARDGVHFHIMKDLIPLRSGNYKPYDYSVLRF
ncbi:DUF4932 domain-containing protein [Aureibacter tunicatorum]|uniref:Starch-binding module 26 domain-containing protein n=1 Tax=Aureibacter tunicatorum TaxID=866807 RepID=A0AAE4BT72_9BACT|nr:DUF4932 domain-containing protein [Aureibacter tunicatorum]MDR6240491.1 hypothetical protein [Aureibacter tunicatorum]BDD06646.1 hypothetical protein AUTU_41290 [Aureibacter tunicatorum]